MDPRARCRADRRLVLSIPLLAALVPLAAGCGGLVSHPLSRESGTVYVVTPLSALESPGFLGAKVTLTQGNLVRELLADAGGDLLAVTVEDLPAGDWQVRLDLYDDAGDITHTAAGTVRVRPGETATLRLEAQPADGFFEILADAGGFSRWDQVERARVVFHNNQTSTLEPVPGEPLVFHGRKALKPGDYDFRVELYGATLYAADRLYQSPWESVRIHPGKTSRVTWEAAAGIAHLELVISPMPDPPRDLRLERESAGAALAWSPSADPRVHAYRVYVKDDEFGPFSLRGEVPAPQTSWPVPEAVLERGGWAAVTALTDQREGFRSEVLRIPPLAAAEPGAP